VIVWPPLGEREAAERAHEPPRWDAHGVETAGAEMSAITGQREEERETASGPPAARAKVLTHQHPLGPRAV
jgi:hypothetical protein